MMIETKTTTIQLEDILAVEYECQKCHAKSVRPITELLVRERRPNVVPRKCDCGARWIEADSSAEKLTELLDLIALFRNGTPVAMRFQVSGIDQLAPEKP